MSILDHYSEVYLNDGLELESAKTRYQKRRTLLGDACDCPYVIKGVPHDLSHPYPWATVHAPYFQDPLFQYLTGINQSNCAVFVDSKRNCAVLFVGNKDPKKEFWDGARLGGGTAESEAEILKLTGLKTAPIDELESFVSRYMATNNLDTLGVFWHERKEDQPPINDYHLTFKSSLKTALANLNWPGQLINISPFQWPLRLCLDSVDIGLFRTANQLTLEALKIVEQQLPYLKTEQEVCGLLQGELLKRTSKGLSFYPIVASGKNAAVLHYHKNDAIMNRNSLILIDCGLRYHSMPADITRTYPINGSFTPLQKLLHDIVLETQSRVESEVKEGVTIAKLNECCWSTMNHLLEEKFLSKGGQMERPYEVVPHNVSHLIGLAVHDGDPYRNYRDMPLKAGMVISNEPGLYGRFQMTIDGVFYDDYIGIRIEDDLEVTALGCANLTR